MNKSFTIRILFAALVISVFSSQMYAQVFQKNYSLTGTLPIAYNFAESIQQTSPDGGFILQGWNMSLVPRMELIKTDPDGLITWKKEYSKCIAAPPFCLSGDPTSLSMGGCVQQTNDDGYILCGSLDNAMLLIKTNSTGDVEWAKTYGSSSYGKYVRQTSDLGYICVGYSSNNIFIVKTNSSGALQWDRAYQVSTNYNDEATDVDQLLPSGDFVVTGYSTTIFNPGPSADTTTDIVLLRLSSAGALQWLKTYGQDSESEEGQSVRTTSDGGYIVAGHTSETSSSSAMDVFLWKFNSSDAPVFQYNYKLGGALSLDINFGYAAQETADGGYAMFGVITSVNLTSISYFNNFLLKLDNNGDNVFCKKYKDSVSGGLPFSLGWTIWNDGKQLDNGGYIIGGSGIPMSAGTGLAYKIIRTNSIGESGCSEANISPVRYSFSPAAEPLTPTNLATGSSAAVNIFVNDPTVAEELVCYVTCTARPGNDTTICEGTAAFQLGMDPAAINGTPPYTYTWSPATDLNDPSLPNPTYTPTSSITYTLTIQDSEGCSSSDDINITVLENADATINLPGNLCVYDASVFLTAADTGGIWTGTGIVNGSTGEFSPLGVGLGNYWVYYNIPGLCGDIDSVYITVTGQLYATITDTGPLCLNNFPVNLSAIDINGIWTGPGITDSILGTFDPDSAGIGTHLIIYTISGSCGDVDSTEITVLPAPKIDVTLTPESCLDALDGAFSLTITGGTPDFLIKWNNDSIIQNQNTFSTNMLPPGNYLIIVIDSNGCTDTNNSSVIKSETLCTHNIYIPNIFSPNGDQINDILVVRGLDPAEIKEMKFSIYDRWGEKVFESTDITLGWNGDLKNKEMNPAVFVYYFSAVLVDDQTIVKKGSITLVR